jgi:hypothetical protein
MLATSGLPRGFLSPIEETALLLHVIDVLAIVFLWQQGKFSWQWVAFFSHIAYAYSR